ncbi:kinase-like domain-containing protein [Peziza echinospora]|nr:kinase-like domain-containing protein [Peziza echinospora]
MAATPKTLIKQGAEAHLYHTHFLLPTTPCLLKHRPPKPYRHPLLDARLTKHRVLSESRLLIRLARDAARTPHCVTVPQVYFVDESRGEIYMEWIEGVTVKDMLNELLERYYFEHDEDFADTLLRLRIREVMEDVGYAVGRLHHLDVVHGDLTTSNLMLRGGKDLVEKYTSYRGTKVTVIDFGLGGVSSSEEDKAVDLYVLERAFVSTHPKAEAWFAEYVLGGYGERKARGVLKRLKEVRKRGRKKSMIG